MSVFVSSSWLSSRRAGAWEGKALGWCRRLFHEVPTRSFPPWARGRVAVWKLVCVERWRWCPGQSG